MDIKKIHEEMHSPALREISSQVETSLDNLRSKKIDLQQAKAELFGAKTILQALGLDWHYHKSKQWIEGSLGSKLLEEAEKHIPKKK